MSTLQTAVGLSIKARREALQLSQATAAERCRHNGLATWSRNTVASVEIGRRSLTLLEAVGVATALDMGVQHLFSSASAPDDAALKSELGRCRDVVLRTETGEAESENESERLPAYGQAALEAAARHFERTLEDVDEAWFASWGWSFVDEFVERVKERLNDRRNLRTEAAVRATVIRLMYRELDEALAEYDKES